MQEGKRLIKILVAIIIAMGIVIGILIACLSLDDEKIQELSIPTEPNLETLVESLERVIQADSSIKKDFPREFDVTNPNHRKYQEIRNMITVVTYSDVSSFRQILQIIEKKNQLSRHMQDIVSVGPKFYALGRRSWLAELMFYKRKDLAELVDMLEVTRDPHIKDYIATAITYHSYARWELKRYCLEDRPLTPLLEYILRIMEKEKEDVIKAIKKEEKQILSTPEFGYSGEIFWYFTMCAGLAQPLYRDHPLVRTFFLNTIQDKDENTVLRILLMHSWYSIQESGLVDAPVEILLDTDSHPKLREKATFLFWSMGMWSKIDTPNKKKFFEALCKAAESDPDKGVRDAAVKRIELFAAPEAKAFLEKLKSGVVR